MRIDKILNSLKVSSNYFPKQFWVSSTQTCGIYVRKYLYYHSLKTNPINKLRQILERTYKDRVYMILRSDILHRRKIYISYCIVSGRYLYLIIPLFINFFCLTNFTFCFRKNLRWLHTHEEHKLVFSFKYNKCFLPESTSSYEENDVFIKSKIMFLSLKGWMI